MMDADRSHRPDLSGYDAELRLHNVALRRACTIQFRDHVLDIGCGTGQTTRQAARTAKAGSALGVDISAPAIERADAQDHRFPADRNEWDVAIQQSLDAAGGPIARPSGGPDPFSLADPPAVTEILAAAGFGGVTFTDVHEPVYYGPNVASALNWVRGFTSTSDALERLDPATADRALGRLREMLAAHTSDDGVWFNSRAWIVIAYRH